jgi:hypothetical protein
LHFGSLVWSRPQTSSAQHQSPVGVVALVSAMSIISFRRTMTSQLLLKNARCRSVPRIVFYQEVPDERVVVAEQ